MPTIDDAIEDVGRQLDDMIAESLRKLETDLVADADNIHEIDDVAEALAVNATRLATWREQTLQTLRRSLEHQLRAANDQPKG